MSKAKVKKLARTKIDLTLDNFVHSKNEFFLLLFLVIAINQRKMVGFVSIYAN